MNLQRTLGLIALHLGQSYNHEMSHPRDNESKTIWNDRLHLVASRIGVFRHQSRIRKEPAMKDVITHVALDAHMRMLQVAMLLPGKDIPIEWQVANENGAIRRMVKKIRREAPGEVRMCYEAGPCGY